MKSEEEMFNSAIGSEKDSGEVKTYNYTSIPFVSLEDLLFNLKCVFPTASQLTMCDLNDRDVKGRPALTTKKMNQIHFSASKSNYEQNTITVQACWKELFVIVEGSLAYVKVINNSIGDRY